MLTVGEYKIMRGITNDEQDSRIEFFISLAKDEIENYTNNKFEEGYPVQLKNNCADLIDYYMLQDGKIKSQSLEGNSVTFDSTFKDNIFTKLEPFKKVRW